MLLVRRYKCDSVLIIGTKIIPENESKFLILSLKLLSILLDLSFDLLAVVIQSVPLLQSLFNLGFGLSLVILNSLKLTLQIVEVVPSVVQLLSAALLFILNSCHLREKLLSYLCVLIHILLEFAALKISKLLSFLDFELLQFSHAHQLELDVLLLVSQFRLL